jgi:hypothetical protein
MAINQDGIATVLGAVGAGASGVAGALDAGSTLSSSTLAGVAAAPLGGLPIDVTTIALGGLGGYAVARAMGNNGLTGGLLGAVGLPLLRSLGGF